MIRSTFLHLPGVGPATEAELWQDGILDWADLRRTPALRRLPDRFQATIERTLDGSEAAWRSHDPTWFGRRLPDREHWRLYPEFADTTAFLDIETTSLSPYEGIVTVTTVYGRGTTRSFVAGEDLEELPAYLRRFALLVTFNGSRFDVPFLRAAFPAFVPPEIHIDLRFLLYRLGLAGGLKRIESVLGLGDRSGVEGVDGLEAVRLWQEYRRGNPKALDRLVRYNRADTVNLEPLLELAVRQLETRLLGRPHASVEGPARPNGS